MQQENNNKTTYKETLYEVTSSHLYKKKRSNYTRNQSNLSVLNHKIYQKADFLIVCHLKGLIFHLFSGLVLVIYRITFLLDKWIFKHQQTFLLMKKQTMMLFQLSVHLNFPSIWINQYSFGKWYTASTGLLQTTFLPEERGYGYKG